MKLRWILAALAAATSSVPPAGATVRGLRIEGDVLEILGGPTSLFPLPVAADDELAIEFYFDDEVGDAEPDDPTVGLYPLGRLGVAVAGTEVFYKGLVVPAGFGFIRVQTTPEDQLWSVGGCRGNCDPDDHDEVQFIVHLPGDPLTSDALVPPPAVAGAVVEFLLVSSNASAAQSVTADVFPTSLTELPEPAAPLSLAAGALVLAAARRSTQRGRMRAPRG
jgi:hypothetical protein